LPLDVAGLLELLQGESYADFLGRLTEAAVIIIFAWLIILFVIVHVYMSVRDDLVERSGTISSIITGYKTAKRAHLIEAEEDAVGERKTLDVG